MAKDRNGELPERDGREEDKKEEEKPSKRDHGKKSKRRKEAESDDSDEESRDHDGDKKRSRSKDRKKRRSSSRRHRRRHSDDDSSSISHSSYSSDSEESFTGSESEASDNSLDESGSEDERRRRKHKERRRRKEREHEKERRRRRREREKEKDRKRRKRDKDEKKKKDKHKKKKTEKGKGKEDAKKGAVTNSWGKYGIIRETDMWNKRPEFTAWLAEIKQVNLETLPNWEEKQMFKEFMEDHNTATFPSKKYYDLDAYHRHKMDKASKKGLKKVLETERTVFNDEEQRRLELLRERERQKEGQVEALKRDMQSGMAQAMKEQAQLREEMAFQYKLGNFEAAAAIQRRLDPDVAM